MLKNAINRAAATGIAAITTFAAGTANADIPELTPPVPVKGCNWTIEKDETGLKGVWAQCQKEDGKIGKYSWLPVDGSQGAPAGYTNVGTPPTSLETDTFHIQIRPKSVRFLIQYEPNGGEPTPHNYRIKTDTNGTYFNALAYDLSTEPPADLGGKDCTFKKVLTVDSLPNNFLGVNCWKPSSLPW